MAKLNPSEVDLTAVRLAGVLCGFLYSEICAISG